jgi:hypothetical protein
LGSVVSQVIRPEKPEGSDLGVPLGEEELGQVGPVLADATGDQSFSHREAVNPLPLK